MNTKTIETTVRKQKNYEDESYPEHPSYKGVFLVTYSGRPAQHHKYLALKEAVLKGIEHMQESGSIALSCEAQALQDWAINSHDGFRCEHMPWHVLVPKDLYMPFIYSLRAGDTTTGLAAYNSVRRYGTWV